MLLPKGILLLFKPHVSVHSARWRDPYCTACRLIRAGLHRSDEIPPTRTITTIRSVPPRSNLS